MVMEMGIDTGRDKEGRTRSFLEIGIVKICRLKLGIGDNQCLSGLSSQTEVMAKSSMRFVMMNVSIFVILSLYNLLKAESYVDRGNDKMVSQEDWNSIVVYCNR